MRLIVIVSASMTESIAGVSDPKWPMPYHLIHNREPYKSRIRFALKAIELCSRQILRVKQLTPEIATRFGWLYPCYEHETDLHAEDSARDIVIRVQAAGYPPNLELLWADCHNSWRMELEPILYAGSRGKYQLLRNYLNWRGRNYVRDSNLSLREQSVIPLSPKRRIEVIETREVGKRLMQIATIIPEQGPPLQPPLPAWIDPDIVFTRLPSVNLPTS